MGDANYVKLPLLPICEYNAVLGKFKTVYHEICILTPGLFTFQTIQFISSLEIKCTSSLPYQINLQSKGCILWG